MILKARGSDLPLFETNAGTLPKMFSALVLKSGTSTLRLPFISYKELHGSFYFDYLIKL